MESTTQIFYFTCPVNKIPQIVVVKPKNSEDIQNIQVLSVIDEPLIQSEDLIPDSITRLRQFVNFIVPTVSAIVTAHIGLLSFFGLEKIGQLDFWKTVWYISPVLLMAPSLFLFYCATLPSLTDLKIGNIINVEEKRNAVLRKMNTRIIIGFFLFSIGLVLMALVLLPVLPTEHDDTFSTFNNQKFK